MAGTQLAGSERRRARAAQDRRQRLIVLGAAGGLVVVAVIILLGVYITQYRAPRAHVLTVGGRDYDAASVARRGSYFARYEGGMSDLSVISIAERTVDILVDEQVLRQRAPTVVGVLTEDEVEVELALGFGIAVTEGTGEFDKAKFRETLRPVLKVANLSRAEYFDLVSAELFRRSLRDVFDAELESLAPQVRLSRIRLTNPREAQMVRELALNEDADFAALAFEYTDDVEHRDDGGEIGWFTVDLLGDFLNEEVAVAVSTLQPGDVSPIVAAGIFFDVYKVTEREQERDLEDGQRERLVSQRLDVWMETERLMVDRTVDLSADEKRWIDTRVRDEVDQAVRVENE